MHVALTTEQADLVAAVARVVADHPGDQGAVTQSLTAMGLTGLRAPEHLGGGAAGAIEVALVVEQLARVLTGSGYLGAVLALELIVVGGGAQVGTPGGRLVADIGAGSPAGVALDPQLRRCAPVDGDDVVALDATADAPVLGVEPDGALVAGRAGERLDGVDLTRSLRRLAPVAAPAPARRPPVPAPTVPPSDPSSTGSIPGRRDQGRTDWTELGHIDGAAADRWQALALALVCADMVGAMSGALDGAVAHARDRQQFGQPIGSFQAVQQLCADQLVSIEAARSVTWHAAWAVDALDQGEALHTARVAKAWCAEVGREVCEAAIQVWGGVGMTWECDAHRYLRRVLLDRHLFGDERVQLAAIADRRVPLVAAEDGG